MILLILLAILFFFPFALFVFIMAVGFVACLREPERWLLENDYEG